MLRNDKERIVAELAERLRQTDTLIVADYRGLGVSEFEELRGRLIENGARISVVKNTLTRLAAEAAGAKELLELVDGPTAIAFIQPDGDPVAVAKVLSDTARTSRVLVIRGGLLEGRPVGEAEVEELAKVPPADLLRGQVLGAIVAPLNALVGLIAAPLQDLHGLLDARSEQLGGEAQASADEPAAAPEESEATEDVQSEPVAEAAADETEPAAEAAEESEEES